MLRYHTRSENKALQAFRERLEDSVIELLADTRTPATWHRTLRWQLLHKKSSPEMYRISFLEHAWSKEEEGEERSREKSQVNLSPGNTKSVSPQ